MCEKEDIILIRDKEVVFILGWMLFLSLFLFQKRRMKMCYFDETGFLEKLQKASPYEEDDIMSPSYFDGLSPQEVKRKKNLIMIALRIMRAKTTNALKKISLEDIVESASVHDEVCDILSKATAGDEFEHILKALKNAKSCIRRRVL